MFSYPQRTHFQKLVFCLLSNVAMAQGVQLISTFEIKGEPSLSRGVGGDLEAQRGQGTCVSARPSQAASFSLKSACNTLATTVGGRTRFTPHGSQWFGSPAKASNNFAITSLCSYMEKTELSR